MTKRLLIGLVLLGGLAPTALAQLRQTTVRFDHFDEPDGLSDDVVNALLQDAQGFLWIGTEDGLNRYDGYGFTVFRHDPADTSSLHDTSVHELALAADGGLWLGTFTGIEHYDPATGHFTRYADDSGVPSRLPVDQYGEVLEDRQGNLWAGSSKYGLFRLAASTGAVTHFPADPDDPSRLLHPNVVELIETRDGTLWVATGLNGLHRFDPATESFVHVPVTGPGLAENDGFTHIIEDEEGRLWLGGWGLYRLDPATGEAEHFLPVPDLPAPVPPRYDNYISALAWDRQGRLWVGTYESGLFRLDTAGEAFTHFPADPADPTSISSPNIRELLLDRSGVLWVGTEEGGLSRLDPRHEHITRITAPGLKELEEVFEDREGRLWLVYEGTLLRWDPATGRTASYRHGPGSGGLTDSRIYLLRTMPSMPEVIWAGTVDGALHRMDMQGRITARYDLEPDPDWEYQRIYEVVEVAAQPGILWAAVWEVGLCRLDTATGANTCLAPSEEGLAALPRDLATDLLEPGVLWVASDPGGLQRFDTATQTFTHRYRHDPADPTSLSIDFLGELHASRAEPGILWVGTWSGGLNRFDTRTGRVRRRYTEQNSELTRANVFELLEEENGTLWVGTARGAARLDPQTGDLQDYTAALGLPLRGTHGIASRTGEIVLINRDAAYRFDPALIERNTHAPEVVLTDLRLRDEIVRPGPGAPLQRPLAFTSALTLPYEQRDVAFDYVALDYVQPEGIRYAYRLEGYEEAWHEVEDQRRATYTNLPPGRYTFRVKAANADGVWNEEGASVGLMILPPWWRTRWAYLLYGMLFVGGLVSADRFQRRRLLKKERERARRLEERSRELEQTVAERTAEIRQRVEELSVINSVQQGLVAELDMQAIYNLVGDRFRDLFDAQVVVIATFDPAEEIERIHYLIEKGERFYLEPRPFDKVRQQLRAEGEVLLYPDITPELAEQSNAKPMPGTVLPRSAVFVPMIVGSAVRGYVSLQNLDRTHAFDEDNIRLLKTLTNSMSVALENARLFAETRQQAAELDTVNRISRALVAQLDFDALVRLVGEQMRKTFRADLVYVALHDRVADVIRFPYEYGDTNPERPFGSGLTEKIITTRAPLLINRDLAEVRRQLQAQQIGKVALSYLGVPILVGQAAIGVISVQSTEVENRFDEADLRLLGTIAANVGVALQNAEAYRRLHAALEELKATQQQLVQQEKMASLGALTAGIAHEIKNPLNFVNNFASLSRELAEDLEVETDPEEVRALLANLKTNAEKIEEHGKRADGIVRSMMAHARGSSGARQRVDLNALVEEHVTLAYHSKRAIVPDFTVEIACDYGAHVGAVEVRPQELGRVVLNLVGNAFDAVREHAAREHAARVNGQYAPEVKVTTRRLDEAVEIRVEDNGPGIADGVKARIFEPFFTTKPTGAGTGLGLSLSYDIVTSGHGGTLEVESEEGRGAAFIIHLPQSPRDV